MHWLFRFLFLGIAVLVLAGVVRRCRYDGPRDIEGMVAWSYVPGVEAWLERGGDPNLQVKGWPLLNTATGPKGGIEILRVLLDAGADPNPRTGQDWTPLMNAANWSRLDSSQLLVARGADVLAVTAQGRTTVGAAEGCRNNDDVVAYLKAEIAKRAPAETAPEPPNTD